MVQHYFGEGTLSTTKYVGEGLVISWRNGRCHRELKIPPFEGLCVNTETERIVVIKELNMNNVCTTAAPKYISDKVNILRKIPWPHLAIRQLEGTNISGGGGGEGTDYEICSMTMNQLQKHQSLHRRVKSRYRQRTTVKTKEKPCRFQFPDTRLKIRIYHKFLPECQYTFCLQVLKSL
jgi:hypothetical protein